MSALALRASGLGKRCGRSVALDGVDLELPAGASLAVVGPNGAGKSTLLRLIAGLARPTSGSLAVGGTPAHLPAARARVGFIGHASLLYPSLTARENLIFAARLQQVEGAALRVERWLEAMGLSRAADLPVSHFSRGMAQRLRRAGWSRPLPVLLDEPFAGLDPRAASRLAEQLASLHADGRTLVLVTHDPKRAAELADRAIVLDAGRIVFESRDAEAGAEELERAVLAASDSAA
jgi:ABC-type multidrug transport system ATPase subunit